MQDIYDLKPLLNGKTLLNNGSLSHEFNDNEFDILDLPIPNELAYDVLQKFDGETKVSEVINSIPDLTLSSMESIIDAYHEAGFLNRNAEPEHVSGLQCLLEVEDLQNKLMHETLYKNVFWQRCQDPDSVPQNVYYGMAIENYHFLFRESWFDSPILGLPSSIEARGLMNEFFCEEYGHDELILKSLNNAGITREQIYRTVPLPETLALCNALAHWSATDPLFFFSTMGVLEGKDLQIDSYVTAMEASNNVDDSFIKHIRDHSNINLNDEHGNLSREIFRRIPAVSKTDVERMKHQSYLFIEIYDRFYTAIWEHYSTTKNLLRIVD